MKVVVVKETILAALTGIAPAIASNVAMPILYSFLFESKEKAIFVTANNLEIAMQKKVPIVQQEGEFSVCIPADKFIELIKNTSADFLAIEWKDTLPGEILLTAGRSVHKIRILPPDDFVRITQPEGQGITILSKEFQNMVDKVTIAASSDTLNPTLSSVLFTCAEDCLVFAGVDGFRFSIYKMQMTPGKAIDAFDSLVPAKQLIKAAKAFLDEELTVWPQKDRVFFQCGNVRAVCLCVDGKFPDWHLFPTAYTFRAKFYRAELLSAFRQNSVLAGEKNSIQMEIAPLLTEVNSSSDSGVGHVTVSTEQEGDPQKLHIVFNADYVCEALGLLDSERITIGFSKKNSPMVIETDGFVHGILPMTG